ncbi:MAG: HNH endonuclease, partial [Dehalococcoidia bacterium]|nr:HNH endonuclease [Dehalococcoidia bacterium]
SRLDPSNGLCLNALHDRAFERGLIVVDDSYTLRVAPLLRRDDPVVQDWLVRFDGTPLRFPSDSPPGMGYLRRHRSRFEWAASL